MDKTEEYIGILTEQIRCVKAREGVAEEIRNHIEDQAEAYEEAGMPHEEAVGEAVRQMGDPVEAGVELDRVHRPKMDWRLVLITVLLDVGGLLTLAAIQWAGAGADGTQAVYVWSWNQFLYMGAGLLIMVGVCMLDYSFIGRYSWWLYGLFFGGQILQFVLGDSVNGMYRDMIIPMYLFVPVYAGVLYRLRGQGLGGVVKGILLMLPALCVSWRLIPSVSTAVCIYVICTGMLLTAILCRWFVGSRKQLAAALAGVGILFPAMIAGVVFFAFMADYQRMRFRAWLSPEEFRSGAGYIYHMMRQALESSRWFGSAYGQGAEVMFPVDEYSLLGLVFYFGIFAGLAAAAAFAYFLCHVFSVSLRQRNQLGMMVGMGCSLVLAVNILLGAAVCFGLVPATTVIIPFFTQGIRAAVVYHVLIGLLLSVCRYRNVLRDRMLFCGRLSDII